MIDFAQKYNTVVGLHQYYLGKNLNFKPIRFDESQIMNEITEIYAFSKIECSKAGDEN